MDVAIVTWLVGKKEPKTRHAGDRTCAGACAGEFWGFLFGLLFFCPRPAPLRHIPHRAIVDAMEDFSFARAAPLAQAHTCRHSKGFCNDHSDP
jgi:hypothetical protein